MATISVVLPTTQDAVVKVNPDGAFEGGILVTGATTRAFPPGDPDATNPLAAAIVYPGGTFEFTVGLDVDLDPLNQNFITDTIVIQPAAAQNLGSMVRGIEKEA